jgi:hypothetical protein
VKYNTSGAEQWVQRYNGPGNFYDTPYSIAVDNSGSVFVTGSSGGNSTGLDYATIKYSQLNGVQPVLSEIPDKFALYQNYPNPFNPVTSLKFEVPVLTSVKIYLHDILGRELETIVNEQLQPGTYEVKWDGSNYPSGVYFYTFQANNYKETRKLMLIK